MGEDRTPISPVVTRPDSEIADELRQRFHEAIKSAMEVMDDATRHGLVISFNIALTPFGRHQVQSLSIVKHL